MTRSSPLERHLIAVAAALLGLFNIILPMLPRSIRHVSELGHAAPVDAVIGSRFLLLIMGMALVAIAPALWSGKRVAWAIALGCAAGSALLHPVKNLDLWGAAASVLFAGVLLGARTHFPARSDPPRAARGIITLAVGIAGVFTYSVLGLYFLDREFTRQISIGEALENSFRLVFIVPAVTVDPTTRHGSWFVESVRLAFAVVFLLGVVQLIQPLIHRARAGRHERQLVRELLETYGRSSIAYFALLPDKSYFFSDPGHAVLPYKVIGSNAIVLGDPLGDEREFPALLAEFQQQCELNGWAYAFHQAMPAHLPLYASYGLKALKIGEEGVIDLKEFSMAGQPMKPLRLVLHRFQREGYRANIQRPPHLPDLLRRLRHVSDEWLRLGKRRERTFTLGHFDESFLQGCDLMVVVAPDSQIVAFANIIPSYHLPQGNFDMLRYLGEPKGLSEFVYLSLIEHFRSQGYEGMNLGLAPFSGLASSGELSAAERAMVLLYRYGDFIFRAKGLREFKEKFQPRWEPRYLVYNSDMQLPGLALAVGRAGELGSLVHLGRNEREGQDNWPVEAGASS
jgi:phosphatidylglycerol lysyltransferase